MHTFINIMFIIALVFGVGIWWLDASEKGNQLMDKLSKWLWD